MLTEENKSSIRIKLEDIYNLADKFLHQEKLTMIVNEISRIGFSFEFVIDKTNVLKDMIIKGVPFSTALVYRVLSISGKPKSEKPQGCLFCDDGYVMAIDTSFSKPYEFAFSCPNCDLGRFRNKIEKLGFYNNQQTTENEKVKRGELNIVFDKHKLQKSIAPWVNSKEPVKPVENYLPYKD